MPEGDKNREEPVIKNLVVVKVKAGESDSKCGERMIMSLFLCNVCNAARSDHDHDMITDEEMG